MSHFDFFNLVKFFVFCHILCFYFFTIFTFWVLSHSEFCHIFIFWCRKFVCTKCFKVKKKCWQKSFFGHYCHMTHDTWHMTHDTLQMTYDTWHMTNVTWHMTHFPSFLTIWSGLVSALLSAQVKIFSVFRIRDYF